MNLINKPSTLEDDIRETLKPTKQASIEDLGRMSAEAVLTQYEAAARSVEDMGTMVKEMVNKLGKALLECDADMKHVAEAATAIREKGKHTEALIDQVSALSKAIRETCADFKKKVGV